MPKTVAFFCVLLCCLIGNANAVPLAIGGHLDLSTVDLSTGTNVALDGEWAFYPGQLIGPNGPAPKEAPPAASLIELPATWTSVLHDGKKQGSHGIASFRLQISPPDDSPELALRIFDIHTAYRLWLNGTLISARGTLNTTSNAEVADLSLDIPTFHNDGRTLDLILEVSNHHFLAGGITESILLGTEASIRKEQSRRWGIALFFVGSLLMMGCYHLVFFFFRRSSISPLYFGLYCLLWMGNFLASNVCDRVILLFFPGIHGESILRADLICFLVSVPVGYLFFQSQFPNEFSTRLLKGIIALFSLFALTALFAPLPTALAANPIYYLVSMALIAYCLTALVKAHRANREGAGFILAGFAVLGIIAANDMLNDMHIIHSRFMIPLGVFLFIISQGFALSRILSRAFVAVEDLTSDLQGKNQALQEEMRERARLETEIVNLSENERRSLSRELHDGLCQQLVAARFYCAALKEDLAGRKVYAQVEILSGMLDESVNHAYGLSRGLWPIDQHQQGMSAFLEEFCRRLALSSGVEIQVRNRRSCTDCSNAAVVQLYRIAQEAITNAVKHARATLIEVELDCSAYLDHIALSVRDNGIGRDNVPQSPGGLGMEIMAHRARIIDSELYIADIPTGGTEVRCTMHCAQHRVTPQSDDLKDSSAYQPIDPHD